jgi:Xaa-Pro aminopeptidase
VHEFLRNRARGEAYGSIIASGDRGKNTSIIFLTIQNVKTGELILMDFGANYGGYAADLNQDSSCEWLSLRQDKRKFIMPVCICTIMQKALLKPGVTILDYHDKVGEEATQLFLKIGLLKKTDVKNEDKNNRAYRKYLYHGISHHLGIDVHDLGTKTEPLKQGMLLTVEPGIYIEEEKMGVRIENNVWITKNGNQDLMKNIPETVEEIEQLMKR